jgi:O-antigen ligase
MAIVNRKQPSQLESEAERLDLSFLVPSEHLRWVRPAIILGVLAAAAGLAFFMVDREEPVLGLAAAAMPLIMLGVVMVALRLKYAPALLMFFAAFVPVSLPTGTGSRLVLSLVLTALVAGLWAARMIWVERRLALRPSPANVPVLGFIVVVLISVIWSNILIDPLVKRWSSFVFVQGAATLVMVMLPAAFLMTANLVDSLTMVKVMVGMLLAAGVIGLVKQYEIFELPFNTGGLYTMWIIALAAGLGMFGRKLGWLWRGLFIALAGAWVFWGVILHVSWVTGWLPGLVALGVLIGMRSKIVALLATVMMVAVVYVNQTYYTSEVDREQTESGAYRLAAWKQNWRVTGQHLLFGTGPAGYAAYYMSYFPTEAMATHSNYVDIIAQTGVTGTAFYLAIFGVVTWRGYRLARRLKGRGDFAEALANGLLAGTVACVVANALGDWLIPFAYTQTIAGFDHSVFSWLLMGLIPALERLTPPGAEAAPHA